MPQLEPIRSTPNAGSRPSRPQSTRARSSSAGHRHLHRVYSAQHLDDVSTYHAEDHDAQHQDLSAESDFSVEVQKEEDKEAARDGEKQREEQDGTYMGVRYEQDIEAPLETMQTSRHIKDPNLVKSLWIVSRLE